MATAYHSVPQASGSVYSAQRSSKLLMRKIPHAGVGNERNDDVIWLFLKFCQMPFIVDNSYDFNANELRNTLRKKRKTVASYFLVVPEKIRL